MLQMGLVAPVGRADLEDQFERLADCACGEAYLARLVACAMTGTQSGVTVVGRVLARYRVCDGWLRKS